MWVKYVKKVMEKNSGIFRFRRDFLEYNFRSSDEKIRFHPINDSRWGMSSNFIIENYRIEILWASFMLFWEKLADFQIGVFRFNLV